MFVSLCLVDTGDHDKLASSCLDIYQEGAVVPSYYNVDIGGAESTVYCNHGNEIFMYLHDTCGHYFRIHLYFM